MKNITVLSLGIMMLIATVSCVKTNTNQLTGTYTGTLTSTYSVKEDVQLAFTNAHNKQSLFVFGMELEKISDNQFNADATIVLEIVHLIDTNITEDILSNASATFVFEDDEVTMDMKYSLYKKMLDNTLYVRYIGKK